MSYAKQGENMFFATETDVPYSTFNLTTVIPKPQFQLAVNSKMTHSKENDVGLNIANAEGK
jgi:hypothetical protein